MRVMMLAVAVLGMGGVVWGAEPTEAEIERLNEEVMRAYQKGRYAEALTLAEQVLAMRQKLYPVGKFPDGHPDLATSVNNLGVLLNAKGEHGKAEPFFREALAMRQKLHPVEKYPSGHPDLPISLNNLGALLQAKGDYGKAEIFLRDSLAMRQKLYPADKYPHGHPDLATSLNNLGSLLKAKGEYSKAEPFLRGALAVQRKLYPAEKFPDGHPLLASSLNNVATLLKAMGEQSEAERFYRDAFIMTQKLYPAEKYPNGHPDLAGSLNNLGYLLEARGEYSEAVNFFRAALSVERKLYPVEKYRNGHPQLATSLHNLGSALEGKGESGQAEPFYRDALAMTRKLYPGEKYPDGHPNLASSLNALGSMFRSKGEHSKAEPFYRDSLAMYRRVDRAFATSASEAELLNIAATRLGTKSGLLDVTTAQPAEEVGDTHAAVWTTKGVIARTLARRSTLQHTAAAADPETRSRLLALFGIRQDIARLAFAPSSPNRDESLRKLTDEKESLERELASALPPPDKADASPTDLAARLPKEAAFVDLFHYSHRKLGVKRDWTHRYAAFIVRSGKPVIRVELGDADPIDKDAAAWRAAVLAGKPSDAASRLYAALWKPLLPYLSEPGPDSVVYLSPAGDLHALPWAALPGSKLGSVLLEDTAIVLASGPDLLDALTKEHKPAVSTLLAVGGVSFGEGKPWPPLPATADEVKTVTDLAPTKTTITRLADTDATPDAVLAALPKSRWAHFATHGFFAAGDDAVLLGKDPLALGRKGERISAVARNPLVQTGLVLANANAGDGQGMLTAEAIAGLDLRNLDLVVLSACETGLGENVSRTGEGVFGLQRAFHLAGTRNVVASLWKVDDEATAALMKLFYHGLWVDNLSPAQALRRAQLALLRHPDARTTLARTPRGPNFDKEVKRIDAVPAAKPEGGFAEVRYWAAFTVSGVGR